MGWQLIRWVRGCGRRVLGRGLSLEEVARKAKVSRSMISEVERGAKVPSILVLESNGDGLGYEHRASS
jgi:transcriptional regulator with XRE-family HTH domain